MSEKITLSMSNEYKKKLEFIAKAEHRNYSNLVRKWIDENYEKDYEEMNEVLENEQKE